MSQAENTGAFSFVLNPDTDQPESVVNNFERQRAAVIAFLESEGFRPEITETGRVYFKFEGHHVYFEANENDDQQFSLMIPDVWPIAPGERDLAIRTAHFVSERFRCAKALVLENNQIWIVYDGFYGDVVGACQIFCVNGVSVVNGESIAELNGKTSQRRFPVADRHRPFLADVA